MQIELFIWIERQKKKTLLIISYASLLFQTTMRRDSNRAKLGPEQGNKQQIPPTFIKN